MFSNYAAFFSLILCSSSLCAQTELQLKTASNHQMKYYLSLPDNWSSDKKWPVLVVCEAAEKEFKLNAERFIAARKKLPFIIVAPITVTNGNSGKKDPAIYPYSESTWKYIDLVGDCAFDMEGLQSVLTDVRKNYSAEEKYFITGFEAGAHLVWAVTFQHPEQLLAAIPVAGNYRSRCMESNDFSDDKSKSALPIMAFSGSDDTSFGKNGKVYYQWEEAKKLALDHGYKNVSETIIQGKGHIPLPDEVMTFINSIYKVESN